MTSRSKASALQLLLVPAALLALAAPVCAQQQPMEKAREITVVGTGEASAKPDIAMTGLSVLRTAETAREALDAANAAMAEVVAAMKALGIEARDLQTSGFQINPQYRYENRADGTQLPPVLIGYEVRNTLQVRIRDIAAIGGILDKAVTLGVNQGGDISFGNDDPSALRTEAHKDAVADARATAETLAEAAGVSLGRVVSISTAEEVSPPMPAPMVRMAMAAPEMDKSVPIEAGENTVTATVRIVFEIGETTP